MEWKLADAKNRFSEVVNLALTEGPQRVRRRNEAVVVVSAQEFERLSGLRPGFKAYLAQGESFDGLSLKRDTEPRPGRRAMKALLDTCVLTELRKPDGHKNVKMVVAEFADDDLFLSVLTVGEIAKGIALLAAGRKKRPSRRGFGGSKRISMIVFCRSTRKRPGSGVRSRPELKRPARSSRRSMACWLQPLLRHGLHVMTRNTGHFQASGVLVIDPW